jgi:hypothetical protein
MTYHILYMRIYHMKYIKGSRLERERQRQHARGIREAWGEEIFLLPT